MVFSDQMLHPRRVAPVPKHLAPPRVNLNSQSSSSSQSSQLDVVAAAAAAAVDGDGRGLPSSPLGVWYLDGCDAFVEIASTILAYKNQQQEDHAADTGDDACGCDEDLYDKIARLVQMKGGALLPSSSGVSGNYTVARGRRNVNLQAVPSVGAENYSSADYSEYWAKNSLAFDSFEEQEKTVQRLQVEAANIAQLVSRRMEVWLDLPSGSMQQAHEKGLSSSLRLLDYPAHVEVPPHTDGSAYTIVYNNNTNMMIQCPENDDLWYELVDAPKNNNNTHQFQVLLMLGSHLDQAIAARLHQMQMDGRRRRDDNNNIRRLVRAPVHRLTASATRRRALTLHVKADTVWPLSELLQAEAAAAADDDDDLNHRHSTTTLTAADYHDRDIAWDAELFSQYLAAKYVQSVQQIQDHVKLLTAIVEGGCWECESISDRDDSSFRSSSSSSPSSPSVDTKHPAGTTDDNDDDHKDVDDCCFYRLPSVHCTAYWQLQTERYRTFLRIHQKLHRSSEAAAAGLVVLQPPREIHHVWLCHQLHPLSYKADCEKLLGPGGGSSSSSTILDHNNGSFCLPGNDTFHEHWLAETGGVPWPSRADLRLEAANAAEAAAQAAEDIVGTEEVAGRVPQDDDKNDDIVISANLWHNYDGLSRLYDELRKESPRLFMFDSDAAFSLISQARLDYARFLIAASYASTVGMNVTPSGLVDLVWHTHQTNPQAYNDFIQKEFPTAPIDHVPCGALNPPSREDGKEWLEMTDKIWTELYGHGVNVQGQAIHCCTPVNARPTGLVTTTSLTSSSENNNNTLEVAWFLSAPSIEKFAIEFPSTRAAVVQMTNLLSANNLNVDDLLENVFRPLAEAIFGAIKSHKESMRRKLVWFLMVAFLFAGLFTVSVIVAIFQAVQNAVPTTQWIALMISSVIGGTICVCGMYNVSCCQASDVYGKDVCLIVESFKSRAMERGIDMRFLSHHLGPVDPAHPGNTLYNGMAIVFRRGNPPAIEESPLVSAANEQEQMPIVAAYAYPVEHMDQDSTITMPVIEEVPFVSAANEEEQMPTVAAYAYPVGPGDQYSAVAMAFQSSSQSAEAGPQASPSPSSPIPI